MSVWDGRADERIDEGLQRLGEKNLLGLLRAHPLRPYSALCTLLGPQIAPVQLRQRLLKECGNGDALEWVLKDALIRLVLENCPTGVWGRDCAISAGSAWVAMFRSEPSLEATLERVVGRLSSGKGIPKGWLPDSDSDAIFVELFRDGSEL